MIFNNKQEKPKKTQVFLQFLHEQQEKPKKTQVFLDFLAEILVNHKISKSLWEAWSISNQDLVTHRKRKGKTESLKESFEEHQICLR